MRLYLTLLFLVYSLVSNCQPDPFWYIKDGNPLSISGYGSTLITTPFQIVDVVHPNANITNPGPARNDIFIIFNNGSYFNSRVITDRADWALGDHPEPPIREVGYNIDLTPNIDPLYLYFTNVYEGDEDPSGRVTNGTSANHHGIQFQTFQGIQFQTFQGISDNVISTNHDISLNDDITIIINHDSLDKQCSYKLCFDKVIVGGIEKSIATYFPASALTPNPIFGNKAAAIKTLPSSASSSYLDPVNTIYDSGSNCITLPPMSAFTYVNLRAPSSFARELLQQNLIFTLEGLGVCSTYFDQHEEQMVASNDPNYMQVLCVKEDLDGSQIVKYRVQCYNDSDTPTSGTPPTISFTLPSFLDPSTIIVDVANSTLLTDNEPTIISGGSNPVVFKMQNNLDGNPTHLPISQNPASYAVIEFCVRANVDIDLENVILQPGNPHTVFDGNTYAIEEFIDPVNVDSCFYEISIQDCTSIELDRPHPLYEWTRPIADSDCGCSSPPCPFYYIWCGDQIRWLQLIALGLLIFTVTLLRKKKLDP